MKEKILAELKKEFSGQSLRLLGLIADKLSKTVTEESAIEGAIAELEKSPIPISDLGKILQQEGDARVTDAKKKWDLEHPAKGKTDNEEEEEEEEEEETTPVKKKTEAKRSSGRMPKWAEGLVAEVKALRTEKVQSSIRDKVKTQLGKDVPERFWSKWALPEKEEDVDAFVEEIKNEHTAIEQERVNKNLDGNTPPVGGGVAAGQQSATVIKTDIKEWADRGKQKEAKTAVAGK
jgi:hypothetical protein